MPSMVTMIWCIQHPRKFKEGICCGGHLVITHMEVQVSYCTSGFSLPNNFLTHELPFPRGLK